MEIVSAGPLPAASILWQPAPGKLALTVVCRATFVLTPIEAELAADQDPPNEEDTHWNDDPSRSLSAPSDVAPLKLRADVILVGNAFAPRGEPVRSLVARLCVGEIDKSIEVFGERSFTPEGAIREGARFTRMPLRWERTAGGPETSNPVGMRLDVKDTYGATAIPNLQPLGLHLQQIGDHLPPVGFGPIAPSWPSRREHIGHRAGDWPSPRWMDQPLPPDLDPAYFNAAPRDQQIESLRDDERIILENLHPSHPRLVTSLPGLRPRARVERRGKADEEVMMRADTLWIDTDRGICTLTWRGRVSIDQPREIARLIMDLERPGSRALRIEDPSLQTMIPHLVAEVKAPLPFVVRRPEDSPMARSLSDPESGLEDLPLEELFAEAEDLEGTVSRMRGEKGSAREALPFSAPALPVFSPPVSSPPAPARVTPPSLVQRPLSQDPIAPRLEATPWAGGGHPGGVRPGDAGRRSISVSPQLATEAAFAPNAAAGGLLAASDLAASAEQRPREEDNRDERPVGAPPEPRAKVPPREAVKLVWFDTTQLPRIRKQQEWRRILGELDLRLVDEAHEDLAAGPLPPETKDRRAVLEVLLRGGAISADGVKKAVDSAIREDGGFEPPLSLLTAELEMPFDEFETLKATATAARPLASGDKRLKEALDVVDEQLRGQWLTGSGGIAERLTGTVREAFAQAKRGVPPDYLETQSERMLLEQRAYQRRSLYGKKWLRSVMRGASGLIPVYLPEEMKDELPMFRRFRVKMLAEVDLREDQGESSPWAVKVIALGRVISSVS